MATRTKIYPGEIFIVEYVNGALINRWAINASKEVITVGSGRKVTSGYTDVVLQPDSGTFPTSLYHITSNLGAIKYLTDDGVHMGDITYAEVALKILQVAKTTEIYDKTGSYLGTIPAGSLVATDKATAGNSYKHFMVANAYNANDGAGWKFLNQVTYSYGFLNIQSGYDLSEFKPNRNLKTALTNTIFPLDWTLIRSAITTTQPEYELRNSDLYLKSPQELINLVNNHFASIDLKSVEDADPISFFQVSKNKLFTLEMIEALDVNQADTFELAAAKFNQ